MLQVYNVNFLYVLKAFTAKSSSLREEFKRTAREKFRRNFLKLLDEKYVFWAVWPKTEWKDGDKVFEDIARAWLPEDEKLLPIKSFVSKYGRILAGKMFRPKNFENCLIITLEKESAECKNESKFWKDIEGDCRMIAPISPAEIWDGGYCVKEAQKSKNLDGLEQEEKIELKTIEGKKYIHLP